MKNKPISRLLVGLGIRQRYAWEEGIEINRTFNPEKRMVDLLSLLMLSALRNAPARAMLVEFRLPTFIPVSNEECDEAVAIFNQERWRSIDVLNGEQELWQAMEGVDKSGHPNVFFWRTTV